MLPDYESDTEPVAICRGVPRSRSRSRSRDRSDGGSSRRPILLGDAREGDDRHRWETAARAAAGEDARCVTRYGGGATDSAAAPQQTGVYIGGWAATADVRNDATAAVAAAAVAPATADAAVSDWHEGCVREWNEVGWKKIRRVSIAGTPGHIIALPRMTNRRGLGALRWGRSVVVAGSRLWVHPAGRRRRRRRPGQYLLPPEGDRGRRLS